MQRKVLFACSSHPGSEDLGVQGTLFGFRLYRCLTVGEGTVDLDVEMLIESRTWTARGEIVTDRDGGSKEDVRDDVASTTYVYRSTGHMGGRTACERQSKLR